MREVHKRDTNSPRDHPLVTDFYDVVEQDDGTVDIYLKHELLPKMIHETGCVDYDIKVYAVRGIVPWWSDISELEADIRKRFIKYLESAEVIYL